MRRQRQADFSEQARVAWIHAKRIEPGLDAKPWHAVGTIRDALAKPLIRGVGVAQTDVDVTDFIRAEVAVLVRLLHLPNEGFRLFLPAGNRKNVRFEGGNRRGVAQLRGSVKIVDGFLESMLLSIGQTLKGQSEGGIRVEFEGPSRELDRFVVASREYQVHAAERMRANRQWIDLDRAADFPYRFLVPRLAREIGRVGQTGRRQRRIEIERTQQFLLGRRSVPVVHEMNESECRVRIGQRLVDAD